MANLGDIVRLSHIPYTEEDLVPVSTVQSVEDQKQIEEEYEVKVPLYKDLLLLCEKLGISAEHFYFTKTNRLDRFCYYEFPVFLSLGVLTEDYLLIYDIKKRIENTEKYIKSLLAENDYDGVLTITNDNAKVMILNRLYWELPLELRYEIWVDTYRLIDYGHEYVDKRIVEDAISHQSAEYREQLQRRLEQLSKGKTLTIYRGEGTHSTPVTQARSWTVSLATACFFASRYDQKGDSGRVYQATIDKAFVIDYLTQRNEEEILVHSDKLEDVHEYPMINISNEIHSLQEEGYIEEYGTYHQTFMLEDDYLDPYGIHGIPHVKRVLYHTLAMSRHLGLSDSERAILANSALYHDIGRQHDGHCTEHGVWSWQQLKEKMLENPDFFLVEVNYVKSFAEGKTRRNLRPLTREEQEITRFIMEYHCRDDKKAKRELKNRPFSDKEKAWKLYEIFKDCDGLDRVRLGNHDLDEKYLRTEVAKERMLLAIHLKNVTM